jgi:hypothetical protein
MISMAKGHDKRSPPVSSLQPSPPTLIFFNPHDYVGQPKGILDSQTKVNMYVIISEQPPPPHSWTRCHLELHVHHCLGESYHLLFPRLRGFPLLIGRAPWRPWYDGGRHGSSCFINLHECFVRELYIKYTFPPNKIFYWVPAVIRFSVFLEYF